MPTEALERLTLTLAEGQSADFDATLALPGPGYYRIIARAENVGETGQRLNGRPLKDAGHRKVWVWVDDDHMRITAEFEPELFPDELDPVPGPHRPRGWRGGLADGALSNGMASLSVATATTTARFHALYYNLNDEVWRPIPNTRMVIEYWDRDPNWNRVLIHQDVQQTDANGRFEIDCQLASYYTDGVVYTGTIDPQNQHVRVLDGSSFFGERNVADACQHYEQGYGYFYDEQTGRSSHAFVLINISVTAAVTPQVLGAQRPRVDTRLRKDDDERSFYHPSWDQIVLHHDPDNPINSSAVWGGPWELFVQSHEYGHAYHHVALGGWPEYHCPPDDEGHYLDGPHGMSCAYVEGVANFIGAVGRPDLSASDYWMRQQIAENAFYPGVVRFPSDGPAWDGAMIEGAVASFLYRLTHAEWLGYDGTWLGGIVQTCTVDGNRGSGVDHLIFCMEEQIDPAVTASDIYFQDRSSHPSTWDHSAGRPQSWSAAAIRDRWTTDLYSAAPENGDGDGGGDDDEPCEPEPWQLECEA